MRYKKKIIISIIVIITLVGGYLFYQEFIHKPTITSYQDSNSYFYECSKPIAAKKATIPHLFGESEGLVPVSQEDAKKYCHVTGIE